MTRKEELEQKLKDIEKELQSIENLERITALKTEPLVRLVVPGKQLAESPTIEGDVLTKVIDLIIKISKWTVTTQSEKP